MSLELGNKIGEGGCSEIYECKNSSKVIKLAKDNTSFQAMKREYENNSVNYFKKEKKKKLFQF